MTDVRHPFLPIALLCLLSACAPERENSVSATVNLTEADQSKHNQCSAAFGAGERDEYMGSDGSAWIWLRGGDGTLSHYCRKQADGAVTAWIEASGRSLATHRLQIRSNDDPVFFKRIDNK
ncbi:MAG: hypothetical protein ACK4SJ_05360 [Sphingorhabdus sp.]